MSAQMCRTLFKACLEACGHDPAKFGLHASLRGGGLAALFAGGVSRDLRCLMGRFVEFSPTELDYEAAQRGMVDEIARTQVTARNDQNQMVRWR